MYHNGRAWVDSILQFDRGRYDVIELLLKIETFWVKLVEMRESKFGFSKLLHVNCHSIAKSVYFSSAWACYNFELTRALFGDNNTPLLRYYCFVSLMH